MARISPFDPTGPYSTGRSPRERPRSPTWPPSCAASTIGPSLYTAAATNPDLVVARIPEQERRFMTAIPLAGSGPWAPGVQEAMRAGLAAADARIAGERPR